MAENVVRVSGLTKTFGKNTVLSNVNISLERGKIYGFIGQNGAGKTTLINHITDAAHLIAGGVDRLPELTLIQRLVGQNDGLALHVGGGNLFDVQRAADGVVHMGFAHGTGHTGYLHGCLNHNNPSF